MNIVYTEEQQRIQKFIEKFKHLTKEYGVREGQEQLDLIAFYFLKNIYDIEPSYNPTLQYNIAIQAQNKIQGLIQNIQTQHPNFLCNVFELIMHAQRTSSKKDVGEFYTPRHIVQKMINLLNLPQNLTNKTFCDPFCGSGGMLVELRKRQNIDPSCIYGQELTNTHNIALINGLLHNIPQENIKRCDTFKTPPAKYDYVLTNPPFGLKNLQDFNLNPLYQTHNKKCETLTTLVSMHYLKQGGCAAIIQPHGFLFDKANQQARRLLLQNFKKVTIHFLPANTFIPFTSVNTCIMLLENYNPTPTILQPAIELKQKSNLTLIDNDTIIQPTYEELEKNGYSFFSNDYNIIKPTFEEISTEALKEKIQQLEDKEAQAIAKINACNNLIEIFKQHKAVYKEQLNQLEKGEEVSNFWDILLKP